MVVGYGDVYVSTVTIAGIAAGGCATASGTCIPCWAVLIGLIIDINVVVSTTPSHIYGGICTIGLALVKISNSGNSIPRQRCLALQGCTYRVNGYKRANYNKGR